MIRLILKLTHVHPIINALSFFVVLTACSPGTGSGPGTSYFVDSEQGLDSNSGTDRDQPWQSLEKVSLISFQPGDIIHFKKGSSFEGCVTINGDGTAGDPILITAYGEGKAPSFSNPDVEIANGNAMRLRGDYHIVENLLFQYCAPAKPRVGFEGVWSVGALHISPGNDHVVVRNNEFSHNAKAIQSYSEHSLITNNYIHHGNEDQQDGFLSFPYWGPIAIHLGIGNQEVSHNLIEHMYVGGGEWGGDGGAIEIDDGRNHKDNVYIHHNVTSHNMGFLEISYTHDIEKRKVNNIVVEYNQSKDYQDFVLWWANSSESFIRNNTIDRTLFFPGLDLNCVFCVEEDVPDITRNIVVVNEQLDEVFACNEKVPAKYHYDNCYWNVEAAEISLGTPWGEGEFVRDPLFKDFPGGDFELLPDSPVKGYGAL